MEEEVAGLGEGGDELSTVVGGGGAAELVADTVEGVATVAREVVDLAEEGDVVVGVVARAFLVLMGLEGGELRLPVAQKGGVDAEEVGDFADGMVEFVGHGLLGVSG